MKEQPAVRTSPAIAAAAAAAGILAVLSGIRPGLAADLRPAEAPFVRAVTVAKVNRTCFAETLPVTGTVVARSEVLVRPDRDGLGLSEVLVEPGDTVSSVRCSPA